MKLNEGLVFKTKLDDEIVLYLEKVIESFCLYLPIYKEISFLVPEKKSENFVVIKSVHINDLGKVEINEGESISFDQYPEAKNALESGAGQYRLNMETTGGQLFLPISKNSKIPFCVVQLVNKTQDFYLEDFGEYFHPSQLMDEIYTVCYSKFIVDPYVFISENGENVLM